MNGCFFQAGLSSAAMSVVYAGIAGLLGVYIYTAFVTPMSCISTEACAKHMWWYVTEPVRTWIRVAPAAFSTYGPSGHPDCMITSRVPSYKQHVPLVAPFVQKWFPAGPCDGEARRSPECRNVSASGKLHFFLIDPGASTRTTPTRPSRLLTRVT